MEAALGVLGYMLGTKDKKVVYKKKAALQLEAYSDASFEEWGSTAGLVLLLAGAQIRAPGLTLIHKSWNRRRCVGNGKEVLHST